MVSSTDSGTWETRVHILTPSYPGFCNCGKFIQWLGIEIISSSLWGLFSGHLSSLWHPNAETIAVKFSPIWVWLHPLMASPSPWKFSCTEPEGPGDKDKRVLGPKVAAKPKTTSWRPDYWLNSQSLPSYLSGLSETKWNTNIITQTPYASVIWKVQSRTEWNQFAL